MGTVLYPKESVAINNKSHEYLYASEKLKRLVTRIERSKIKKDK